MIEIKDLLKYFWYFSIILIFLGLIKIFIYKLGKKLKQKNEDKKQHMIKKESFADEFEKEQLKKENENLKNKINQLEKELKNFINKKKGLDYEVFVAKKYIEKGYEVILHGVLEGRIDYGIDLIAKKENETILIQCKNWQIEQSINQEKVLSYYGRFKRYVDENALDIENTKLRFIAPDSKIFKISAIKIFQDENYLNYRYEIIKM